MKKYLLVIIPFFLIIISFFTPSTSHAQSCTGQGGHCIFTPNCANGPRIDPSDCSLPLPFCCPDAPPPGQSCTDLNGHCTILNCGFGSPLPSSDCRIFPYHCCPNAPPNTQNLPFTTWETATIPGLPSSSPLGTVINRFITYLFPLAGIVLLAYLIFGGYQYLTSMGDPKKIQASRLTLTYALVGFAILIAAYWVVLFSARVLDIPAINQIFQ